MNSVLLDTCIVIDYLRQRTEAVEFVHGLSSAPVITAVTAMELYVGVKGEKEERILDTLIENTEVLDITGDIGIQAGKHLKTYRPSHSVDVVDALIAATAEIRELELVTLNLKHFPMFESLQRPY